MSYASLRAAVDDLATTGRLLRLDVEIDPYLEAAEIQRRVYAAGGPAILFNRLKGCEFPAVSNLFGTRERTRWLFRDTLRAVEAAIELKIDPSAALRHPWRALAAARTGLSMRPKYVRTGPVQARQIRLDQLPQIVSWPRDGGPFVTLPLVYTEHPAKPGWAGGNLGMYRVQLAGNQYQPNAEVGLHYQIHRGIGVHHAAAVAAGKPLRVVVNVGGPPALSIAAVMPLPEGFPETSFAGALGGRRVRLARQPNGLPLLADADFCIVGVVDPQRMLPEGPFGDHLGYYSLAHDFPVLKVEQVYARQDAIWPFTTVGRPPQEDTSLGELIHDLTGPAIPTVLHGVRGVHAVDAAGVHPLLLALGSERYTPYAERRRPQELLTQASAILGQGQLSLAKYLWIAAADDDPQLHLHDVPAFFAHVLRRVDWRRDLHFHTETTIDTLDYSGHGLNQGSKLVTAAVGPAVRSLPTSVPGEPGLPLGFKNPRLALPGILVIEGPKYEALENQPDRRVEAFCREIAANGPLAPFPLLVIVDDSEFAAQTLNNFLWVTFTRSNPARDVQGVGSFIHDKHWGCTGPLVIDARIKPHHAPPLVEDPAVTRRVDALAAPGGPLHGVI